MRCVRDSNPWPHAWQACILTNWTNAPIILIIFLPILSLSIAGAKVGGFNLTAKHIIWFFLHFFWNLFVTRWFTTGHHKYFLKTTEQEENRTHIIILRARMYAHVEGYGSSNKCIVLIVHRRYVEFKKLWGSICYCSLLFLWIHRKRGRKISSNREIPEMACRAMTESIKITAFFRPTSGNLFLPSSFHLSLKRPVDGGSGSEWTSCHHPFSLLSFVKHENCIVCSEGRLWRDLESTDEGRMMGELSGLINWLPVYYN